MPSMLLVDGEDKKCQGAKSGKDNVPHVHQVRILHHHVVPVFLLIKLELGIRGRSVLCPGRIYF